MNPVNDQDAVDAMYEHYGKWKRRVNRSNILGLKSSFKDLQALGLPAGSHILEVGFGSGDLMIMASDAGYQVVGIERQSTSSKISQILGVDSVVLDWHCLEPEKFDAVVAFDVFEHIKLQDMKNMLEQVLRVLKPNGVLLARFPNCASPFGLMNQYGDATHVQAWSGSSFTQFAMASGFVQAQERRPSYVWWDGPVSWKLIAFPRWLLRRVIELVFMVAYGGQTRTHLDPNTLVVAKKN